jgi:alpha-galactosidase
MSQRNLTKFPDGIEESTEKLKLLGSNAGIYGDLGCETCAGYPESYGHEDRHV